MGKGPKRAAFSWRVLYRKFPFEVVAKKKEKKKVRLASETRGEVPLYYFGIYVLNHIMLCSLCTYDFCCSCTGSPLSLGCANRKGRPKPMELDFSPPLESCR